MHKSERSMYSKLQAVEFSVQWRDIISIGYDITVEIFSIVES